MGLLAAVGSGEHFLTGPAELDDRKKEATLTLNC